MTKRETRPTRRLFLKSAGALLPLPLLDCGSSNAAWAATPQATESVATPPLRYLWLYQPNGMFPKAWNPTGEGTQFELSRTLSCLEAHRHQMTVIRNLTTLASGPHVGKCSALLTGVQVQRDAELGIYANAKSVDQWIADRQRSQIPSLQLGIERPGQGYCSGIDTPVSYGATLSWSNKATRLMPETNPRRAFDRLFRRPTGEAAKEQARWKTSLLDSLREQAADIRRQGSQNDTRKIDEYLESIRSLERRLQQSTCSVNRDWEPTTAPDEQMMQRPIPGIPSDRREHMRTMLDLITLAFWTDSTRAATMMMANTLSDASYDFIEGVDQPFHSGCSHHQNRADKIEQYVRINQWHAEQVAYLTNRFQAIKEGDGTLLDHSLIFFGSSLKDGNAHSNIDLPVVMLGGGCGRVQHRGHDFCTPKTNITDLHFTSLKCFGIDEEGFNGMEANVINDFIRSA